MKPDVTVDEVITEINLAAAAAGRPTTKDARKVLRAEIGKELDAIKANPNKESYKSGDQDIKDAAKKLIEYAEANGAFKVKSKVGNVVVQATVKALREEHARTNVCAVWPFC